MCGVGGVRGALRWTGWPGSERLDRTRRQWEGAQLRGSGHSGRAPGPWNCNCAQVVGLVSLVPEALSSGNDPLYPAGDLVTQLPGSARPVWKHACIRPGC